MRTRLLSLAVLLPLNLNADCQMSPALAPPVLEPPVQTAIPTGIYSGELTTNFRQTILGIEVVNTTTTEPYAETVDANGLPLLIPSGEAPVVGLRIETNNADGSGGITTIESVNAIGNKLVIGFRGTSRFASGASFNAVGQDVYEFIDPVTLTYARSVSGNGTLADGLSSGFTITATATLMK